MSTARRGRAGAAHRYAVGLLCAPLAALAPGRVVAQCPDGTPPPCAAARVPRVAAISPSSVAVLYLDNLSRDTADTFLADGLTEELIIRLSQVRRLEVKSRFESQRFRGQAAFDPRTLGRVLRVAACFALRAAPLGAPVMA